MLTYLHNGLPTSKNRLRASMTSERLPDLALLSNRSELLREIQFDDILDDFTARKAKKSPCLNFTVSIFKHTNSKRNHVITKYSVNVG